MFKYYRNDAEYQAEQLEIEKMAKLSGGCLYPNNHCGAQRDGGYCNCDARRLCENLVTYYQPRHITEVE